MSAQITVPQGEGVHWMVRRIFATMVVKKWSYLRMRKVTGLNFNTFKGWRSGARPNIENLEKAFAALGYTMIVVPTPRVAEVDALIRRGPPQSPPALRLVPTT